MAQSIVQNQCGIFVNNLLPYMDHSNTTSDYLNKAYQQIKEEANKVGVDTVDWLNYDQEQKKQAINTYYNELLKNGSSRQDARDISDNYLTLIEDAEVSGKDFM
jgi:hypothetical protein